jgi:hypothetical protein
MAKSRRGFLKTAGVAAATGAAIPCEAEYSPDPPAPADTGEPAGTIPKVPLGKYEISRLIIGANPFYGYSHFNQLFNQHMVEWATPEHVIDTLRECERQGINTWQFSHNERSIADIKRYRAEGGKIQFLLLSSRDLEENLDVIPKFAAMKPIGIVHHGGVAERRWRNGELGKVREFLKRVRDSGVMVGLSAHNPKLIDLVESQNWDIDFYMTALYYLTRSNDEFKQLLGQRPVGEVYLPEDPPRMFETIRKTKRTCLCYKVLAAGRRTDSPKEIDAAFETTFANIKPRDAIIVGMYPKFTPQVAENAARVRRILKA